MAPDAQTQTRVVDRFVGGLSYGQIAHAERLTLGQVAGIVHRSGKRRPRLDGSAMLMLDALTNIVANAVLQPDPTMGNATDCYRVPLDNIGAARAAIAKALGEKE